MNQEYCPIGLSLTRHCEWPNFIRIHLPYVFVGQLVVDLFTTRTPNSPSVIKYPEKNFSNNIRDCVMPSSIIKLMLFLLLVGLLVCCLWRATVFRRSHLMIKFRLHNAIGPLFFGNGHWTALFTMSHFLSSVYLKVEIMNFSIFSIDIFQVNAHFTPELYAPAPKL